MDRPEDETSREKALQTVVAGQQAENLLDFDADEPTTNGNANGNNSLVSDGIISSQAIASAAKSTNPLDELMDLFSSASMSAPTTQPIMSTSLGGVDMSASLSSLSPVPTPVPIAAQQSTMPPVPVNGGGSASASAGAPGKAEDDLLGLF